jgi:cysteine desulfurase
VDPIYLDFNATTPVAEEVFQAMAPYWGTHFGNPSSQHRLGVFAKEAIERARRQVADWLHCDPREIVFTSGGTESNNLALIGLWRSISIVERGPAHFVTTRIEHPAILEPMRFLAEQGVRVSYVNCDQRCRVSAAAIEKELQATTRLVSVMTANNEIGTLQPISEIAELCRSRGIYFHTDAAQAAGKIPLDVNELGIDLLTIAGHKLHAPKGIGALYIRDGVPLERVLFGASQERSLSPGTECVPLIVGLGKAAEIAGRHTRDDLQTLEDLRDRLAEGLRQRIGRSIQLHGDGALRLPNTLSVNFPEVAGSALLACAPGICASTGAACHGHETTISATLQAMGLKPAEAKGTVRLSLGWSTTEAEMELAVQLLAEGWNQARALA